MGFVTEVYSFEHKMPTILESLLFWFASATGVTGGWVIPEVSGDLLGDVELPCTVYDTMAFSRSGEDDMALALSLIP